MSHPSTGGDADQQHQSLQASPHAMHDAYREFMMSGKRGKVTPPPTPPNQSNSNNNNKKVIHSAIHSFHSMLVTEWLPIDDNLHQVIVAISQLRDQSVQVSRSVHQLTQLRNGPRIPDWKLRGYRSDIPNQGPYASGALELDDLHLALSYTLLQHERMMEGARRLLSALAQSQDALGRRIDELLPAYYLDEWSRSRTPLTQNRISGSCDVQECLQLFHLTAKELYRKQQLADTVFRTCLDSLIEPDGTTNQYLKQDMDDPCMCARRCARDWPRSAPKSHLYEWAKRFLEIGYTVN